MERGEDYKAIGTNGLMVFIATSSPRSLEIRALSNPHPTIATAIEVYDVRGVA